MSGRGRGLAQMVSALPDLASTSTSEDRTTEQTNSRALDKVAEAHPASTPQPVLASSPALDQPSASAESSGPASTREDAPPPRVARKAARATSSGSVRAVPAEQSLPDLAEGPRYLRFEPKTVRLTAGQVDALQAVETKLRRAARGRRRQGDELPSWNMLARLGIDLVLREADRLAGVTEDELRASLGLDPLNF